VVGVSLKKSVALENLLRNAWKFTAKRPHARIELGLKDGGGETIVFVKDDGVGFDPKLAAQLFTPFRRLHGASEFEGTGIGLAIVQRIAQHHRGHVWAEAAEAIAKTRRSPVLFTVPWSVILSPSWPA